MRGGTRGITTPTPIIKDAATTDSWSDASVQGHHQHQQGAQLSTTSSQVSSGLGSMVSSAGTGGGESNSHRGCSMDTTADTTTSSASASGKMAFWETRNDHPDSSTASSCLFQLSAGSSSNASSSVAQTTVSEQRPPEFSQSRSAGPLFDQSSANWNANQSEAGYSTQRDYAPHANWSSSGGYFPTGYTDQQRNTNSEWSRSGYSGQPPCVYPDYSNYGGQTQSMNYPLYPLDNQSSGYRGTGNNTWSGWGDVSMTAGSGSNLTTPTAFNTSSYAGLFSESAMNSRLAAHQNSSSPGSNLEELQSATAIGAVGQQHQGNFSDFGGGVNVSSPPYDPLNSNLVVCSMPPLLQTENAAGGAGLYPTAFN